MRTVLWPELLRMPEGEAGWEFLRSANRIHLRWMLVTAMAVSAIVIMVSLAESSWLGAVAWAVVLVYAVTVGALRRVHSFARHSDDLQLGLLAAMLIASALTMSYAVGVVTFAGFLFPAFLVLLRWRGSRVAIYCAVLVAVGGWAAWSSGGTTPVAILIIAPLFIAITAGVGWRLTRRRLAAFFVEYRRQASVERDRARMSEELSDARAIQLSMLPRKTPELPWVDVACACLPATEVGGDYYDFLVLDDDRLAVVIADVAGHGMASGLVLAGVRSGLYLLRDRLDQGVEVLDRLDRMLRDTSPGRMFVTLQIALLDRRRRTVTVANAGHPPLALISGGESAGVGAAGRPLGTRLEGGFAGETRELAAGDTLVLHSDGLSEVRDYRGEWFDTRLQKALRRAAEEPTARGVRDQILARVSHFKGDVEQEDDLTLVVLRLAGD